MTISLTIIFFIILCLFGFLLSAKILNHKNIIFLIPTSLILGCASYVTLLHLLALFVNLQAATYTALLALVSLSVIFLLLSLKKRGFSLSNDLQPKQTCYILVFSVFFATLSIIYLNHFNSYDPIYQSVGTITKDFTYPPLHPYSGKIATSYHYGTVLLASALKIFSGIETWNSFIPIQTLFAFILPLSIFSFLYFATNSFSVSFFGAILGSLCSNLFSYKLFEIIANCPVNNCLSYMHQKLSLLNESGLATSTNKAMMSPNMSVALPTSLVLLTASIFKKENLHLFAIALTSLFLFFCYEAFWFPIVISIVVYWMFRSILKTDKISSLRMLLLLITIFWLTPFVMGGVVSGKENSSINLTYLNPKFYLNCYPGYLHLYYPQNWFLQHEIISHSDGGRFYKISPFSLYALNEFGPAMLCLPFILLFLFIKRYYEVVILLLAGLTSYLVPFFISYIPRDIEFIRFYTYARFIFSITFGALLGYLFQIKLKNVFSLSLKTAVIIITIIFTLPAIMWFYPKVFSEHDYRYNQLPHIHKQAIKWLSKRAKPKEKGIGPYKVLKPQLHFEVETVAGVYGISETLNFLPERETINTAITTLDPCLLTELNVKWLYLDSYLLSKIPKENLKSLIKQERIMPRYYMHNTKERVAIYNFNPLPERTLCKNNDYMWAVGRMNNGYFTPLKDKASNKPLVFKDKHSAQKELNKIKPTLTAQEKYWYRVEAIRIEPSLQELK